MSVELNTGGTVSAIKYINHLQLICKTHFFPVVVANTQEGSVATLLHTGQVRERYAGVHPLGFMSRGGVAVVPVTLKIMSVSLMQTFKLGSVYPF